jgi:hypothetical protein
VSQHLQDGLGIGHATCVPSVERERMQLHWIVDGLAESDSRLPALAQAA